MKLFRIFLIEFFCLYSFNIRPGCKLLLTGVISIKDGFLQLTHDNTRFQYGSNTYSRPRSAYRVNILCSTFLHRMREKKRNINNLSRIFFFFCRDTIKTG
jgi:hypothetical protein